MGVGIRDGNVESVGIGEGRRDMGVGGWKWEGDEDGWLGGGGGSEGFGFERRGWDEKVGRNRVGMG